ncbi:hypothetical protein DBZ36_20300 [Alginatibacterium sediminis]|uniref:Bile acid:sodium symporter n=1 Tax=Alginatibacterium sediminis TaxID=2164068 RepID=A0A420E5J2_9ALTE|nr:hypothetical protein [Alginatibacterium sediminis]RKF12807.1 hypothetical protein DBZ36_20300 [Alginatibacterium sediminis]
MLSLNMKHLFLELSSCKPWLYALWHSLGLTLISALLVWALDLPLQTLMPLFAVAATGSLFASPAIVRSLGLDAQACMAMTLCSTLLMPFVLLLNAALAQLWIGQDAVSIDFIEYSRRLLIYIVLPIAISLFAPRLFGASRVNAAVTRISPYTILVVFFFPLGLMGAFRQQFDVDPRSALLWLALAFVMCLIIFALSYALYRRHSADLALMAAITATNRNVLLTYSVAGIYLGSDYMVYMGAMQLPIYFLPICVFFFRKRSKS